MLIPEIGTAQRQGSPGTKPKSGRGWFAVFFPTTDMPPAHRPAIHWLVVLLCSGSIGCAGNGMLDRWSSHQSAVWRSITDSAFAQAEAAGVQPELHHPDFAAGWRAGYYETLASGIPASPSSEPSAGGNGQASPMAQTPPTTMSHWLCGFAAGRSAASVALLGPQSGLAALEPGPMNADLQPPQTPLPTGVGTLVAVPESPPLQPVTIPASQRTGWRSERSSAIRDDSTWQVSPTPRNAFGSPSALVGTTVSTPAPRGADAVRRLPSVAPDRDATPLPPIEPTLRAAAVPSIRLGPPSRSPF